MQYNRKYEKYHKKCDITDDKQIRNEISNFVKKQSDDDIFPIFTLYERIRNLDETVSVCPIPPKQIVPYHRHDYFEFNYISSGICYQYINNQIYKMEAGELIVFSRNTFHTMYLPEGSEGINILVNNTFFDDLVKSVRKPENIGFLKNLIKENTNFITFNCQKHPFILNYLNELCKNNNQPSLGSTSMEYIKRNHIVTGIIYELILGEKNQNMDIHKNVLFDSIEPTDANVLEYINANFATVTQAELQRIFGFSKMGFYRYIKSKTGNNFCVYVGSLKYSRACYLLQHSDKSISEISREIGFQSTEYFSRFFKKQASITPSEYRSRFKET